MSLVELSNVSLSVGSTQLLVDANVQLLAGQRIALVGPNGSGKSTLLRALAGDEELSGSTDAQCKNEEEEDGSYFVVGSGTLSRHITRERILFMNQDLRWSRLLGADEEELRALPLCDAFDVSFAEGNEFALEDEEMWRRVSVAAHDALQWRTANYEETPLGDLSPGCAMRAYLAVALYRQDIDLLLLDEPTNFLGTFVLPKLLGAHHNSLSFPLAFSMQYLDAPSILWLEQVSSPILL